MALAVALPLDVDGTSRRFAHRRNQIAPRVDRLAVDRGDAIPRTQARLPGDAAGRHLADDRRQLRSIQAQSDPLQQIAFQILGVDPGQVEQPEIDLLARVDHFQLDGALLQRVLQHFPAQILQGRDRLAVHAVHQFAVFDAAARAQRAGDRCGKDRPQFLDAIYEQPPVEDDGEQEIGDRSGGNDGEALGHRLAVEGARQLLRRDRRLALVEHLDVTAERKGGKHPFGPIRPGVSDQQRLAETDGKAQHLDAAQPRHEIVTELMHDDQDAQREGEETEIPEQIHEAARRQRPRRSVATRRACASAWRIGSSVSADVAGKDSRTSPITAAIET